MKISKLLIIPAFALAACSSEKTASNGMESAKNEGKKMAASQPAGDDMKKMADEGKAAMGGDIIAVATGAGQFKTLAKALGAAGLVDTLKGEGPFTVFAPTDAAFAKLPEGTLKSLLEPENKEKLKTILTYHVVPGKVPASKVTGMSSAKTVAGPEIAIAVEDGKVMLNDSATVVKTDVEASNGVIHVIDSVILPPE